MPSRYIARIIRALFVASVGFGGGIGLIIFIGLLLFTGNQHAFETGMKYGFMLGGVFSIFLVGVLLPLDLSCHLFLMGGDYHEIWELQQVREIVLDSSLKQTLHMCRQALLMVPCIGTITEDLSELVLRAQTQVSWRSAGENIEIKINQLASGRWQVSCISSSGANVVFDYAKNYANVEAWLCAMRQLDKTRQATV